MNFYKKRNEFRLRSFAITAVAIKDTVVESLSTTHN
jgi:hypothetical protein